VATPANTTHSWRFGLFEVDAQKEELRRGGVLVKMREQPFRILVFLLEHAGEIVTREDLRKVLWPGDTYVDFDHSLNTAVMKLREALGDTAEKPLYIETVPKRGYRFVAPVMQADSVGANSSASPLPDSQKNDIKQSVVDPEEKASSRWSSYTRYAVISAAGLVVLTTFLLLFRQSHAPSSSQAKTRRPLSTFPILPITNEPGYASDPAISPDGKWIAYRWNGPERLGYEIYVQLLGSATHLQLTVSRIGFGVSNPAWSPDGTEIAFARCEGSHGGVFAVPAMGGTERELTKHRCWQGASNVAWFPNGREILMVDGCTDTGLMSLVAFSVETGARRCVMDATDPGFSNGIAFFTLSPDGKTIVFGVPTNGKCCDLYMIQATGGRARQLTFDQSMAGEFNGHYLGLMWTADSQAIVVSSFPALLQRVPINGGAIQVETEYPTAGVLSPDGRRLFYTDFTNVELPGIWRADLAAPGGPVVRNKKLPYGQSDIEAQTSPDGSQLVWMSVRSGYAELWTGSTSGGTPLQITQVSQRAGSPFWSPDGKWIAFNMWDPGMATSQIYIVDPEGKNLRAITGGPYTNAVPSWSHDGKWIYFASYRPEGREVWKHSLENGMEVQLTHQGGFDPRESYDGKTVYFTRFREAGLWSVPAGGGKESVVIADKPGFGLWGDWAPTKDGIYYLDLEVKPRPSIMFHRFATGKATSVLVPDKYLTMWVRGLSATADGKTIYYGQAERQATIKMIELAQ
jgi:Tol biopolymer transport system component/DNA-binding winged helix-turn-helix (wHTH) protein